MQEKSTKNTSAMTHLAKYSGSRPHPTCMEVPASVIDHSASVGTYKFNAEGFRSDVYDPQANFKIFACGCSYTFATGVEYESTWPSVVKRALECEHFSQNDQITLQNFSQVGAANAYITRVMMQQCKRIKPDLALVAFTHANRTEYIHGDDVRSIGPWSLSTDDLAIYGPESAALWYYSAYNDRVGNLELMKSCILLQSFFKRHDISYVMTWIESSAFHDSKILGDPILREISKLIDLNSFTMACINSDSMQVDMSDGHPGAQSHQLFGQEIYRNVKLAFGNRLLKDRSVDLHTKAYFGSSSTSDTVLPEREISNLPLVSSANLLHAVILGVSPATLGLETVPYTFEHMLRERIAEDCGVSLDTVIIHSKVVTQISIDRLTRVVLTECAQLAPQVVVICWPDGELLEHLTDVGPIEIGSRTDELGPTSLGKLSEALNRFYNPAQRLSSILKNVLLIQEFLQSNGIGLLSFGRPQYHSMSHSIIQNKVVRSLLDSIDPSVQSLLGLKDLLMEYSDDSQEATRVAPSGWCFMPQAAAQPPFVRELANVQAKCSSKALSGGMLPESFLSRLATRLRKIGEEDSNIYPS